MLECWRKCKRILANRILLFKTHYISRESQVPDNIKGFHLLFLCQINLLIAYLVGPWSNIIQLHGQLYPYFVDQKWHFSLFLWNRLEKSSIHGGAWHYICWCMHLHPIKEWCFGIWKGLNLWLVQLPSVLGCIMIHVSWFDFHQFQ